MKLSTMLVVAGVLTLAGCNKQRAAKHGNAGGVMPQLSAEAIAKAYDDGPIDADERFNDKRWRVQAVRVDVLDINWVAMQTETREVRFKFADSEVMKHMRKGTEFDAECEGDGLHDSVVHFLDCSFAARR